MTPDTLTIATLVGDLLVGMGETGQHKRAQLTTFALSALDQLGYAAPASTKKDVRLDIGTRREARVPDDLALLGRVAAQWGEWLVPLVPDDALALVAAEDLAPDTEDDLLINPYADTEQAAPATWNGWPYPAAWNGSWNAGWGREAGTYRYFPTERLLRFNTGLPAGLPVAIEYVPSTHVCGPDTPLSPLVRNAVENYCLWRYNRNKGDHGKGDRYERDWKNARTLYRLQHSGVHPRAVATISDEAAFGRGSGNW